MTNSLYVLYGKSRLEFTIPKANLQQVLSPVELPAADETGAILHALRNPIGSPSLTELTRDVKSVLIITDDNTRPMPSRLTIPLIIGEFCRKPETYDITILIATGLHRRMTEAEIDERFGGLAGKYKVVNHVATDDGSLVSFGRMPSGSELFLNRLVADSDLVIAEGFIEPHFFAGFSGGRKAILPGVAGASTIMNNHSPRNIASPYARSANLENNPVHLECAEAAAMSGLKFILNVALNMDKRVAAAFAGAPAEAHARGCDYVRERMTVPCERADIVITSNNGYPLDRNLYQAVKGMDAAGSAVKPGGVIIIAAECADGAGHQGFIDLITGAKSVGELHESMSEGEPMHDKWQAQILARILKEHTVMLVSSGMDPELVKRMFMLPAKDIYEALGMAFGIAGRDAAVNVIPEGPIVTPSARL